jgi:hypothetical protein
MTLEKFTRQQRANYPAITVRKNGTVSVNNYAIEQYSLQKVRLVTLHYDRKESIMGIKPSDDDKDTSAFRVSKGNGRTFIIACQAFLKHCGIAFKEGPKILKATWEEKGKMMLVKA